MVFRCGGLWLGSFSISPDRDDGIWICGTCHTTHSWPGTGLIVPDTNEASLNCRRQARPKTRTAAGREYNSTPGRGRSRNLAVDPTTVSGPDWLACRSRTHRLSKSTARRGAWRATGVARSLPEPRTANRIGTADMCPQRTPLGSRTTCCADPAPVRLVV